ncbi:DUF2778 domain-containing protein [Superficieibacter sp. BNK-5]|uniref:DUF2778 domain-containing protein n=1 Tax=unclassified Superficieibacter TaxID=2645744 RepID=UPI0023E295AA|nr:DUF2778 domain-containing protein [Superficieibacter sp. HKU1]WES69066.1 DUF2778 domain-containing protein [Superficieibacter sp. HKU1]
MLKGNFILNNADFAPLTIYGAGTFLAFSGNGIYRNKAAYSHVLKNGPLPVGKYWVVERGSGGFFSGLKANVQDGWNKTWHGAAFGRDEWFALYRDDWEIDDSTWVNSVHRGLFRLHPGHISEGCITIPHNSDYARIRNALMNSSPVQVPCMRFLKARGFIEVVANGISRNN